MARKSDRHLPPLAPGPRNPVAGELMNVPRPKKNSTACKPCKQAKRKCSGPPSPCKACEGSDPECIFDESLDLRRKVAIRRTIAELENSQNYYRSLVYSLLTTLRSPELSSVSNLLNLIRSNASLPEIAAVAADLSMNPNRPYRGGMTSLRGPGDIVLQQPSGSFTDSHTRVTLEMLCDIPLFQVPAKPWTTVTDDNHLVSHLVSLYFTWDHPFSHLIDQKVFLEEMAKGDLGSEFCTPFLVNSLLAMASAYSDFPKVFANPEDANTRGHHFSLEAERLWKAEEGRPTLPSIQGMILTCYALRYQGKDMRSWLMLKQAVQLAQDIGMFQSRRRLHFSGQEKSIGMQRASTITALGILVLNSEMSFEMRQIPDLVLPDPEPYIISDPGDDLMWVPYPLTNQISYTEKPALFRDVMIERVQLTEILVDICSLLFDKAFDMGIDDLWLAANGIYSRLQMRLEHLPGPLVEEQQVPQALFVRIKYYQVVISFFSFILDHFGQNSPYWVVEARRARLRSAKEIAKCLHNQRRSYGLNHIPCLMLDAVQSALFALLADLDDDESKEVFIELCRFLVAFRQRLQLADNIIRKIERSVHETDIGLPSEAVAILDILLTDRPRVDSDSH